MRRSNNTLLTILMLAALAMVMMVVGAPGLTGRNPPHDEASVAAMPYTLAGENEHWRAEYRVEAADPSASASADLPLAYQAVFTLTYLGDEADLAGADGCTVTFAPGTDYEAGDKRSAGEPGDFAAALTGRAPLWTLYYPEDTAVAGAIPPADGAYRVRVQVKGMEQGSAELTLVREEARP